MFNNEYRKELKLRLKENEKLIFIRRLHSFLVVGIVLAMLVRVYMVLPGGIHTLGVTSVEPTFEGLVGVITLFLGEALGLASSTLIIIKVVLQHIMALLGLSLVHMVVKGHIHRKEKRRIKRELRGL